MRPERRRRLARPMLSADCGRLAPGARRPGRASGSCARRAWLNSSQRLRMLGHTFRGGTLRLGSRNRYLRRAAAQVLREIRTDRLPLHVSSGWVLLPWWIAALLSPLSFDLEKRVLNCWPRRELPVNLYSTGYTWSQVGRLRQLYARTRAEQPRCLFGD